MSCHPRDLQQIGAGWLWGLLFFRPLLTCEASCGDICWVDDIFCGCSLAGAAALFIHVHCQLFNVAVWRWKRKLERKRLSRRWSWNCCPVAQMKDQVTLLGELRLITSLVLSLLLACWNADCISFCFQGWEFKYSLQILEERTVSSGGCCRLYLVCGSTSVRKHASPVFCF